MTELFEITEPFDRRLALGATGMLRDFNQAGVLTAADVHVARRLGELTGEADERVLLAAALATRAVRHGSVCLDLATVGDVAPELPWPAYDEWVQAVSGSALVSQGVLRWEFDLLYLDRYWHQEVEVCADLRTAARPAAPDGGARRPRRRPGPSLRRADLRRAAGGVATRRDPVDHGAHGWAGHRQDDDRRAASWRCWPSRPHASATSCGSPSPRRPARPRPG